MIETVQKPQSNDLGVSEDDELVIVPTKVTVGTGLCRGELLIILIVMISMWMCSSVNVIIIDLYIKYIPGGIYINFFIAGCAEISANITAGIVFSKFGPRITYATAFLVSLGGGVALIFQEKYTNNYLIAFFVLLAKFGACMSMCCCYVSTPWVFPLLVCGTAFGICNLFGRFT